MDYPILKYLDILTGLAVAMLIASTAVTAIVQAMLASSFARARYLRNGLQELIALVDPELLGPHKRYLAQRVQRHPLVSRSNTPFGWITGTTRNWLRRKLKGAPGLPLENPGNVVQREELVGILLEWAAGDGPLAKQDRELAKQSPIDEANLKVVQADLRRALANGGIGDPSAVLAHARQLALDQELANPQMPLALWRSQAILQAATSAFTGKIFAWFDNTVIRISAAFALEARVLSCAVAFFVCWGIQLDAIVLLQRLSRDDQFRQAMLERANRAIERYEQQQSRPASGQGSENELSRFKDVMEDAEKELNEATSILPAIPSTTGGPGIVLSWMLVSLGAPFWYDALKRLLSLRSLLAQKDDSDRKQRQESQVPPDALAAPEPAPPPTVISDQPDLVEVRTATALRAGKPSAATPAAGEASAGTLVSVVGAVEGESMPDAQNQANKKWYQTPDGHYFWAGATDKP